jgi:hypothetical protein
MEKCNDVQDNEKIMQYQHTQTTPNALTSIRQYFGRQLIGIRLRGSIVDGFIETNNESTKDIIIVVPNRSQIEEIVDSLAKTLLKQSIHQRKFASKFEIRAL